MSDSGSDVVGYYRDHADAVRLSVWLVLLSAVPYVAFVAWVRSVLTGVGRDIAFGGGLSVGVLTSAWLWIFGGLALHPNAIQPAVARTVLDLSALYGPVLTAAVILFAAPVAA